MKPVNQKKCLPKNNLFFSLYIQGVRMIFSVALPMIIGPMIGNNVIKNSGRTYTELGVIKDVPTPMIFLSAALILIPLSVLIIIRLKEEKKC